jgi:hypothetical protein
MIVANRTEFQFHALTPEQRVVEAIMKDAQNYRQYASDCRRMAAKMTAKDKQILEQMAEAWELRAREAERHDNHGTDGHKK